MKITIDPGHGRTGNPYSLQPGYYEGTQMWKLAKLLETELVKRGFEVVNTRPHLDDNPEVVERGKLAGLNGSGAIISLHSNAPGKPDSPEITGSLTIYSLKGQEHKDLADRLAEKISEVMGHQSRGSITRVSENDTGDDYYGVIRGAANHGCTCAIIVEHGFHTNPADSAFLSDEENLLRLAEAEADLLTDYFKEYLQGGESLGGHKPLSDEIILDNAIADGAIADRDFWLEVLRGEASVSPEQIRQIFNHYHGMLK